jgi:hypothetical protein
MLLGWDYVTFIFVLELLMALIVFPFGPWQIYARVATFCKTLVAW